MTPSDFRVKHRLRVRWAEVDMQTKDGMTPLYAVCSKGHMDVIRALLPAGRGRTCVASTAGRP